MLIGVRCMCVWIVGMSVHLYIYILYRELMLWKPTSYANYENSNQVHRNLI
jgi:hypothetical protein